MGACSKTMHTCNTPFQQEPLRSIECLLLGDFGGTRGLGRDMEVSATDCMQATFFQKEPAIQRQLSRDSGGMGGP